MYMYKLVFDIIPGSKQAEKRLLFEAAVREAERSIKTNSKFRQCHFDMFKLTWLLSSFKENIKHTSQILFCFDRVFF